MEELSGRRLLLARLAWPPLAVIVVGLHVVGIPYAYRREVNNLDSDRLTWEQGQALRDLGLTPEFYAAYTVALPVGAMLMFVVIATVIFWRKSEDWMALFSAFTLLVSGGAAITSEVPEALLPAYPALWFPVHLLEYLGQVAFGVFFYVFPNGRFVPRWVRWLVLVWAALWVPNVFFPDSPVDLLGGPFFICFIGSLVIAQVYRYRRVSSPLERQQTKWVVFGVAVALVGFAMMLAVPGFVPAFQPGPLGEAAFDTYVYGLLLLIPLSIGVAILRSRLYDIDVLINRTLVYGSLTATLVALYLGGIVLLQRLFVVLTGQKSTLAVVVSTLVIAALFNPSRRRIQGLIDRRFYRSKYDAAKTLEAFSVKLRDETDLEALSDDLVGVVRETMQPAHLSLWLRPDPPPRGRETQG